MIAFGIEIVRICIGLLGLAILFVAVIWLMARLRDFAIEQWHFYCQPGNRWKGVLVSAFFLFLAGDAVWYVSQMFKG